MSRIIRKIASRAGGDDPSGQLGTSYRTQTHIADELIARDLEEQDRDGQFDGSAIDDAPTNELANYSQHSMVGSYRRPSYLVNGPRSFIPIQQFEAFAPLEQEREAAIGEERSLLRDNNLIPPKHPRRRGSQSSTKGLMHRISVASFVRKKQSQLFHEDVVEDGETVEPTEDTALLSGSEATPVGRDPTAPYGGEASPENIDRKWEEAVVAGQIRTSWQRESKVLTRYTVPLIFTFMLQQSLIMTSVFTVGHIGKVELGAVSLGGMTANITGYAVYHGLTTSLDTLCAQAYGSGNKQLVGLYLQRMVFFLWACTIPIACLWLAGTEILKILVPEQEIAILAGQYLKVLILGAPAYALFESSKRYVQAQGRFSANLYVLLIVAPLNVFLHWLFVWQFGWGFIGCPIAIVIVENLMPLLLFLYVRFVGGMECWPGFSMKAFHNWGPMIRLSLPGLAMVVAEFLAFEILTLASARISATHLGAQTILQSVSVLAYQLPFPLSIAASTRVANLVGASLPDAAKVTTRVAFVGGTIVGLFNMIMLSSLRYQIPKLFTGDEGVIQLAAATLPVNAAFQLFDALAAQCNGILRGIGKQEIGGYVSLVAYYLIAMPISFATAFALHWDLNGLWAGPSVALAIVAGLEGLYLWHTNWQAAADEAAKRNLAG